MDKESRNGHRQRMRETYRETGINGMNDEKAVELFLSLVIPRKDVRDLSYRLINHFGSLEGVFSATVEQLEMVDGIGENTAVLISLCRDIYSRIKANRNNNVVALSDTAAAIDYCRNRFAGASKEQMLLITLDSSSRIISSSIVAVGGANFIDTDPKRVLERVIADKATAIILSHNHPRGSAEPSAKDLNYTIRMAELLRALGVSFNDHIIIGDTSALSMKQSNNYHTYLYGAKNEMY